jgi:hypothetical protein
MTVLHLSQTVDETFFAPLQGLAAGCFLARPCPEFPDEDYLRAGVQRVLETNASGRAFLQEHAQRLAHPPTQSNYFATLHSTRRCGLLEQINQTVRDTANEVLTDRLADFPQLANYECFAADGHWHKAATHDPRHDGVKMPVGNFYSLNLRTHVLTHLATARGLKEHDMSVLKRIKPKGLRQRVRKGRRVLIIYDKAGIDFGYWKRCRQECAVYFLSRPKENMILAWEKSNDWDPNAPVNRGVWEDISVRTRTEGHLLRLISYIDPISGKAFEFLTNEMDLPPGVLVELYRRRWNVEKVFDELKNTLGEKKAWATSLVAKETQAQFLALTHNLLLLYEQALEKRHAVKNQTDDNRRRERWVKAARESARVGRPLSPLLLQTQWATQRSVKFVRWLRQSIRDRLAEATAVPRLKTLYATS